MQPTSLQTALNQILDIIGYADDKNLFISNFVELCLERTLLVILESLPEDQQQELKQKLSGKNQEETINILKEYTNNKDIPLLLQSTSQEVLSQYIISISNTLSSEQSEKIANYLTSIVPPLPKDQ